MPIPRFRDAGGKYDVCLFCPACGWAIAKDTITANWDTCRLCGKKGLVTQKNYYNRNLATGEQPHVKPT